MMSLNSLLLFLFLSLRMELNHSLVVLNLGCRYNHFYFIIARLHLLNHRNLTFTLFFFGFPLFLLLLCILLRHHPRNRCFFVRPLPNNRHSLLVDHSDILLYQNLFLKETFKGTFLWVSFLYYCFLKPMWFIICEQLSLFCLMKRNRTQIFCRSEF